MRSVLSMPMRQTRMLQEGREVRFSLRDYLNNLPDEIDVLQVLADLGLAKDRCASIQPQHDCFSTCGVMAWLVLDAFINIKDSLPDHPITPFLKNIKLFLVADCYDELMAQKDQLLLVYSVMAGEHAVLDPFQKQQIIEQRAQGLIMSSHLTTLSDEDFQAFSRHRFPIGRTEREYTFVKLLCAIMYLGVYQLPLSGAENITDLFIGVLNNADMLSLFLLSNVSQSHNSLKKEIIKRLIGPSRFRDVTPAIRMAVITLSPLCYAVEIQEMLNDQALLPMGNSDWLYNPTVFTGQFEGLLKPGRTIIDYQLLSNMFQSDIGAFVIRNKMQCDKTTSIAVGGEVADQPMWQIIESLLTQGCRYHRFNIVHQLCEYMDITWWPNYSVKGVALLKMLGDSVGFSQHGPDEVLRRFIECVGSIRNVHFNMILLAKEMKCHEKVCAFWVALNGQCMGEFANFIKDQWRNQGEALAMLYINALSQALTLNNSALSHSEAYHAIFSGDDALDCPIAMPNLHEGFVRCAYEHLPDDELKVELLSNPSLAIEVIRERYPDFSNLLERHDIQRMEDLKIIVPFFLSVESAQKRDLGDFRKIQYEFNKCLLNSSTKKLAVSLLISVHNRGRSPEFCQALCALLLRGSEDIRKENFKHYAVFIFDAWVVGARFKITDKTRPDLTCLLKGMCVSNDKTSDSAFLENYLTDHLSEGWVNQFPIHAMLLAQKERLTPEAFKEIFKLDFDSAMCCARRRQYQQQKLQGGDDTRDHINIQKKDIIDLMVRGVSELGVIPKVELQSILGSDGMTDLLQAWVEPLDHGGNGLVPKVQALIKESHTHQQLVELSQPFDWRDVLNLAAESSHKGDLAQLHGFEDANDLPKVHFYQKSTQALLLGMVVMLGLALNHLTTGYLLLPLAGLVVLTLPLQYCYQKLDYLKIMHAKIHQCDGLEPVDGDRILEGGRQQSRCVRPEGQGYNADPNRKTYSGECKA